MIKVKVTSHNKDMVRRSGAAVFETQEEADAWIEKLKEKNTYGLPERWIFLKDAKSWEKSREKERRKEGQFIEILVPADYDFELDNDPLSYKEKRRREYPAWELVVEALVDASDGQTEKLEQIKQLRRQVKQRHPKK